jgi:hypothetical protein
MKSGRFPAPWKVEQTPPGGFKVLDVSTVTQPLQHAPNCCRIRAL